jgi:hypothetical protein
VAEKLTSDEQLDIAERLQGKWLKHMERLLDSGTITSTDMATLARLLMANGWALDPSKLSPKLRDKLIDSIPEGEFDQLPVRLVR